MKYVSAESFPQNLKQEALFSIIKWMLIDTPSSEYLDFFTKYLAIMVLWLTSVNWISYDNVFTPSLKILFLELLPEEYLELTRLVGWKLTADCSVAGSFPNWCFTGSFSSNITLNLLNMGIMILIGIFILWSCIQNIWWASVSMTLIWNMNTKAYLKCLSHFR